MSRRKTDPTLMEKSSKRGPQRPDPRSREFAQAVADAFDKARSAAIEEHIRQGRLPADYRAAKATKLKRAV